MAKHILLDHTLQSTRAVLLEQMPDNAARFEQAHIWVFEGPQQRQALKTELEAHGIQTQVYSAYKPLLHFFLDTVSPWGVTAIDIAYPTHADWPQQRFRLEAYPLAALFPGATLNFEAEPVSPSDAHANTWYRVQLHYGDQCVTHTVFAPNVLRPDFLGATACVPSAWLLLHDGDNIYHKPLQSAYLQCHDAVMQAVAEQDWPQTEPYFDQLVIRADLPGMERRLDVGHETISTTEAMHEELYFSLLEFFQQHSGRELGSRGLQPGQIIPDVRLNTQGPAHVRVHYEPVTTAATSAAPHTARTTRPPFATATEALSTATTATAPLTQPHIHQALQHFAGEPFNFLSRQGRDVTGVHVDGSKPAVLISGAQHANETTGVVGALRAAAELCYEPGAHFALIPLENPDGYALHEALRTHNPEHMHHAARYTALGDDIEYRQHAPWLERQARDHAFALSGARLHLNLHGYPAHEWTRPCTGYLPRNFELWSIPKGFFLILRHTTDARDKANALLEHVTQQLAQNNDLMRYNTRQLETYQQHAGEPPFNVINGVPYMQSVVDDMACDVTLVTEFPDETIYGDDFVFGHSVQTQTVVAATEWWWRYA